MRPTLVHARRLLAAAALAGGVTLLRAAPPSAPAAAPAPPPTGTPVVPRSLEVQGGSLIAPGKAAELELLYTGDVIGYIEPCG